jgi:hypothetical protein
MRRGRCAVALLLAVFTEERTLGGGLRFAFF